MTTSVRTRKTYQLERWRAIPSGVIETASSTFLLLVAVRWFNAGAFSKALVAGAWSLGLLVSPIVASKVASLGLSAGRASGVILAGGAVGFLLPVIFSSLPVFILGILLGLAAPASVIPLVTQIYQENYPETERGRLFSRTIMLRIAAAALFSAVAGWGLNGSLTRYRWLLLIFAGANAVACLCLYRCPSQPLIDDGRNHPLRALRFIKEDVLFRRTLISWMLMGFSNLMMLPLRVEYLANPKYGRNVTLVMIAVLTSVVPNLARLGMSPVWGGLFDRMNFFALRIGLNIGFAVGILFFFLSSELPGLVLGALIYGIAISGGDVAWNLWVTKLAPAPRVADYMAVHAFLTGMRGVVAPLVGFYFAMRAPLSLVASLSTVLIALATLLLLPQSEWRKNGKKPGVDR